MKKTYLILMVILALAIASCSNEDDLNVAGETNSNLQKITTFYLEADKPDFDGKSRMNSSGWENGDKIYLRFTTSSGTVTGEAVYSTTAGNWTIAEGLGVDFGEDIKLGLTYFDGPATISGTNVSVTHETAIYADDAGAYSKSSVDSKLIIKGHLKPITSRIRFKGTKAWSVMFGGVNTQTKYELKTGNITTSTAEIPLTVGNDGYTPYIYCVFADSSNPQLTINEIRKEGTLTYRYTYTADCKGKNMLGVGKSGWMNLPTPSNYSGWTLETPELIGGDYNGKSYVDLGLPSGLKWAACNIGASRPEEYGSYFAWGEVKTKNDYSSSSSSTFGKTIDELKTEGFIGSDGVLIPSYDAARNIWGGTWRMPTENEIEELSKYTTQTWCNGTDVKYNNTSVKGYIVASKINGNSIFLPAAGYRYGLTLNGDGARGYYWSSSPYESNSYYANYLNFSSSNFSWYKYYRYYGYSVRPVSE